MNASSIVDSHVHLWNPAQFRYAWLDGLPALNRPFLPADFSSASAEADVCKMIFVESGCEPAQSLAEVDWISGLAKNELRLKGIVAYAPLENGEAVRTELQALAKRKLVKGIRRNLQGEHDAEFCLRPNFITGMKLLAEFGFTFDLCIRHDQLPMAAELVRSVPQVTFVLDHFGKPDVRGKKTEQWKVNLKMLTASTECRLQNFRPDDGSRLGKLAAGRFEIFTLKRALECFGFDRILFGGDWPVATLAASYVRWIETVQKLFFVCQRS